MAQTTFDAGKGLMPGDYALRRRYTVRRWLRYLALAIVVALAIILLIPIVWMLLGSFKIQRVALAYPPELIPSNPVLDNWERLLIDRPSMRWLLNSFIVAGGIAIFGVITSACAGYAFGKKQFAGRTIFFWLILMTMMLPRQIYMIPLFVLMRDLGWFNSYQGMIAPYFVYPFGVFLMRLYMQSRSPMSCWKPAKWTAPAKYSSSIMWSYRSVGRPSALSRSSPLWPAGMIICGNW